MLDPGFSTNFTERLLYSTYDVTAVVSELARSGRPPPALLGGGKFSLGEDVPSYALLMQCRITYHNDTELLLSTGGPG